MAVDYRRRSPHSGQGQQRYCPQNSNQLGGNLSRGLRYSAFLPSGRRKVHCRRLESWSSAPNPCRSSDGSHPFSRGRRRCGGCDCGCECGIVLSASSCREAGLCSQMSALWLLGGQSGSQTTPRCPAMPGQRDPLRLGRLRRR